MSREYAKEREEIVCFRVSVQVKRWLKVQARREGVSLSDYMRGLVKGRYMEVRVDDSGR
jgi:Mobilization protein NikA